MPWSARAWVPTQCEVCRTWNGEPLCGECRARFAPPVARCGRCGLRTGGATPICGACVRKPPPFERTVVAFDYAFPWDRLIADFKFAGRVELAPALAGALADAVRAAGAAGAVDAVGAVDAAGGAAVVDVVVPVPLSPSRLTERGFNQAWELARRLGRGLGIPAQADALLRAVDTAHQAALTRAERERNLRAAFAPTPQGRARCARRRVALVDDVMTTGTTAREAALALQRGGAAAVELWVLARTPEPGSRTEP